MTDKRKTVTIHIRDEDGLIPSDKKPDKQKPANVKESENANKA